MTEIERMYASLAQEVDTVMLAAPDVLRRRGDRRTRLRIAATAAAVAALVGGVAVGGQWVVKADGAPLPPPSSGTGTPVPSPTTSASVTPPSPVPTATGATVPPAVPKPPPKVIPASAFLQVGDLNGDVPPESRPSDNMLLTLCDAKYASDASIQARKTMHLTYWARRAEVGTVPDGTFDQTITTYRSDGAQRFMQELRSAVTVCPTEPRGNVTARNRVLPDSTRGDESFLIEQRYPMRDAEGKPVGGDEVRLVSVVRVGAVVMVLYEQGWEAGWTADRQVVDTFTTKAMSRLQTWLG
ncbi:MAG TPA: hypothetical protein VFR67_03825 [Pilimelia sp.]|nr:hypothetical protein [Pilimelia sp.]